MTITRDESIKYANIAKYMYTGDVNCIPSGYVKIYGSDEIGVSSTGYNGKALINFDTNELIIGSEGTDVGQKGIIDMLKDLYNDAQLFFGYVPNQYKYGCKPFTKAVTEQFGDNLKNYNITFVGHSLGAAISEIAKYDFSHNHTVGGDGNYKGVVFDNPGTEGVIKNNLDYFHPTVSVKTHPDTKSEVMFGSAEEGLTVFNSTANLINTMSPTTGEVIYVGQDTSSKLYQPIFSGLAKAHSLDGIINNLNYCSFEPVDNWCGGMNPLKLLFGYHPNHVKAAEVVHEESSTELVNDYAPCEAA